jgi:hydrogenase maturation protein HypF
MRAKLLLNLVPWFSSEALSHCIDAGFEPYACKFKGQIIDPEPVLSGVIKDIDSGIPATVISKRFHDTIIDIVIESAKRVRAKTGQLKVVLSGGTWHNRYLLGVTKAMLEKEGFIVFTHRRIPPGDGGIALGQAAIAAWDHN